MTEEARAVLLGMKERLSKGWAQGYWFDRADQTAESSCLVGSALLASGIEFQPGPAGAESFRSQRATSGLDVVHWSAPIDHPAVEALRAVADANGIPFRDLALWNDHRKRTHEDVVAAIDRAIEATAPPAGEVAEIADTEHTPVTV